MLPDIQIGAVSIPTYPLMIGIGALGMLVCIWKRRERFSVSNWQAVLITLLLTFCGIAGAKLLYLLENPRDILEGKLLAGGVSFFGSVFLIPLVMPLVGRLFHQSPAQTNDLCAPCVAIMVGFIRIGCLLNDCCGGWVVYIGDIYFAWPTQIMESIGDFFIFWWLMRLESRDIPQGALYPMLMLSYSILRSFVEFFRYTPEKFLNISHGHWFAMAAILTAVIWLAKIKQQQGKKTTRSRK